VKGAMRFLFSFVGQLRGLLIADPSFKKKKKERDIVLDD